MGKTSMLAPSEDPSLRHHLREIRHWTLLLFLLCCCATGNSGNKESPQLPREVGPDDLVCARDADCEILDSDVTGKSCCGVSPEEPYPISRSAKARYWAQCPHTDCLARLYKGGCHTVRQDWIAVCSEHVCKRRPAHFFISPKKVDCER